MSLRSLSVIACLLVVVDTLFLVPLWHFFGWEIPVIEIGVSALIGLLAIGWYSWRWSDAVAEQTELGPQAGAAGFCLEKVLILVGGVLLILPGFVSDGVGFLLLLPATRRMIVQLLNLCV